MRGVVAELGIGAIEQRLDEASDNAYSVLPYLARAGIVDAADGIKPPATTHAGPVLAWTAGEERESLAMALSMLGLRVRVFSGDEEPLRETDLQEVLKTFDALVDAPVVPAVLFAASADERYVILMESDAPIPFGLERERLRRRGSGTAQRERGSRSTPLRAERGRTDLAPLRPSGPLGMGASNPRLRQRRAQG